MEIRRKVVPGQALGGEKEFMRHPPHLNQQLVTAHACHPSNIGSVNRIAVQGSPGIN
jgi:hypothetical protein